MRILKQGNNFTVVFDNDADLATFNAQVASLMYARAVNAPSPVRNFSALVVDNDAGDAAGGLLSLTVHEEITPDGTDEFQEVDPA